MLYRIAMAACLLLTACETWRADPDHSTEVELASDLSNAQIAAVYGAVAEINAAIGREVFHVEGEHAGYAGHVTITTDKPRNTDNGRTAETVLRPLAARMRLGSESRQRVIEHELLHVILGGDDAHSDDPTDVFYPRVAKQYVFSDKTVQRVWDKMSDMQRTADVLEAE